MMLEAVFENLVDDAFCKKVMIVGVSDELLADAVLEKRRTELFLKSVKAFQEGNFKRSFNMGMRF
ncbi:MAG: hypothetical protein MK132_10780 [Lentisphaerales bacterium]|nr:hypothetical protein [Lentisphaerales bacterium]